MSKRGIYIVVSLAVILLVIPLISAGFIDWYKTITGKLGTTQTVSLNISLGVPQIIKVSNVSFGSLTENSITNFSVNFTGYIATGYGNLNDNTVAVNFSKSTECRTNSTTSCVKVVSWDNYANYSCNITMWWWDSSGSWNLNITMKDSSGNSAQNATTYLYIGTTTGFSGAPTSLTWSGITAGATNQTSTNDPILMNNTGNVAISAANIQVNATNLMGETNANYGLYANNFSVGYASAGGNEECSGGANKATTMVRAIFTGIGIANLSAGNYTLNDNNTGQEQLYFCLRLAGSELASQAYSTLNQSSWTLKIS